MPFLEPCTAGGPATATESATLTGMRAQETGGFSFADLFAGVGGFHAALAPLGGRCVFMSEIDPEARQTYIRNWIEPLPPEARPQINEDIATAAPDDESTEVTVPPHDVLTAGFPCQPFSKSGAQRGMDDARGTLFWNIARTLQHNKPAIVLLENVRNLAGPRHAHEWEVIIRTLRQIGYRVSDQPTVFSPHFLPESQGGTPQVRERVFIVGTYIGPERVQAELEAGLHPKPVVERAPIGNWNPQDWDAASVLDPDDSIPNIETYKLTPTEKRWIEVWDDFVGRYRQATGTRLPGFPLWTDYWCSEADLNALGYAEMPKWKKLIVLKNSRFFTENRYLITKWLTDNPDFTQFPNSRRKLEWQAADTDTLWRTIMQLRPSGIRAKSANYYPALVAITQTSVYGPRERRLTPREVVRLQGMPPSFSFGDQRDSASYKQAGNGVAVGAVQHIFRTHVLKNRDDLPAYLVKAVVQHASPHYSE